MNTTLVNSFANCALRFSVDSFEIYNRMKTCMDGQTTSTPRNGYPAIARSHRKTKIIQSRPLSPREARRVGVRRGRGAKRFGWFSISRKGSGAYPLCETARTQEFVLRWSPDGGNSVKEIVRQQWNFNPPDSIREVE